MKDAESARLKTISRGRGGGISDLIYSGERRVYIAGDREEDASASIATRLLTRLT